MNRYLLLVTLVLTASACAPAPLPDGQVRTSEGIVQGEPAAVEGITAWHGIPYAAPPVGDLRWKAPQPPASWEGVRESAYGNRCIQTNPWPDMLWNSPAESEDCLYLNVWAPDGAQDLPVMLWIHGGGFFAGSGDEKRHEGSVLASKDVVLITMNYRLGVLGFFTHPELTAESPDKASGNYGLLDMIAALEWVKENAKAFGGDPDNVTIFGESAGSFAVSDLMSSPMAAGLFHKAIGQSGGHFGNSALRMKLLADAEADGVAMTTRMGLGSLADLRAATPQDLVAAASGPEGGFSVVMDNHVLVEDPVTLFQRSGHNDVPLMAGWTSAEIKGWRPSLSEFQTALRARFQDNVAAASRVYPATNDAEAIVAATNMSSDGFVVYPTWKWIELASEHGRSPVYRYVFDQVMATPDGPVPADDVGAAHASDIPFVFNALEVTGNPISDDDAMVADLMADYWTNFARSGNPNAPGLPEWPAWGEVRLVMRLNASAAAEPESDRARFEFLDSLGR